MDYQIFVPQTKTVCSKELMLKYHLIENPRTRRCEASADANVLEISQGRCWIALLPKGTCTSTIDWEEHLARPHLNRAEFVYVLDASSGTEYAYNYTDQAVISYLKHLPHSFGKLLE
jgi:hypothetical protein